MATVDQLAVQLTKAEGKKKSVSMGNMREIIGLLSDRFYAEKKSHTLRPLIATLVKNGERRAKELAKKSK